MYTCSTRKHHFQAIVENDVISCEMELFRILVTLMEKYYLKYGIQPTITREYNKCVIHLVTKDLVLKCKYNDEYIPFVISCIDNIYYLDILNMPFNSFVQLKLSQRSKNSSIGTCCIPFLSFF